MTIPLEDIEELFDAVKVLRDERKKMEKLSLQAFQAEGSKAQQKANVELNWQAFHVGRLEHKAHAAAVNAGLAEPRPAERYEPYTVKLSGFHEYEVVPALPRCMTPEPHPEPTALSPCDDPDMLAALRMADETFRDLGWHDKWEVTSAAIANAKTS